MQTKIGKWGASCAVRIPKAFVESMGLSEGDDVKFELDNNRLVMKPLVTSSHLKRCGDYDFDELIEQMKHCEQPESYDDGPIGEEIF